MSGNSMNDAIGNLVGTALQGEQRNLRLEEITLASGCPYTYHSIADLPSRYEADALVLAVKDDDHLRYNPPPSLILHGGMTLVVLGEALELEKLRARLAPCKVATADRRST